MFTKRVLLLALTAALISATVGCGWRRGSCKQDDRNYDPDCRYYYDASR